MIAGILSIMLWLLIVPLGIGLLVSVRMSDGKSWLLKSYIFGLAVYMAVFQGITIVNMFTINNFFTVCTIFSYSTIAVATLGYILTACMCVKKRGKWIYTIREKSNTPKSQRIENIILWVLFGVIVIFQLIQTVRLTYPDGDDAYYVGVAAYGVYVPQMYSRIPYTGAPTEFDTRHCLAPFPYMISFLSRMSQISASVIAHSILPVFFILFAYGIYYLIAKQVCREKREVSLFLVIVSVLLLFGNYSVYSMETFLMTRTRQGKASLGSFVLPLGFYLLFLLAKKLDGKKSERVVIYLLIMCNGLTAALFTTMGNFIYPCLIAVGGLCICFNKKDWKKLFVLALTCIPNVVMAVLYLIII